MAAQLSGGRGGGGGMGGLGQKKQETVSAEEEQLELNMKQLDLLHIKCRQLRTSVQRMLETIPNSANGDELFEGYMRSVAAANAQIKDFSTVYNSEESKRVLEQARKSRDANPKGIAPWKAKDHPDWIDLQQ
ncbi:hypothetical protein M426DRAFT_320379 [Hypoxylon sp. CI-4A]|nr:hypothetical protein M426DRAFT_320379 [Hypoxylon sp. CI-4A]